MPDYDYPPRIASCGTCTSCLLRRQALWASGLGRLDQQTQYRIDVLSNCQLESQEIYNLKAMLSQAARIKAALSQSEPRYNLLEEFPELLWVFDELAADPSIKIMPSSLTDMFDRYVRE